MYITAYPFPKPRIHSYEEDAVCCIHNYTRELEMSKGSSKMEICITTGKLDSNKISCK